MVFQTTRRPDSAKYSPSFVMGDRDRNCGEWWSYIARAFGLRELISLKDAADKDLEVTNSTLRIHVSYRASVYFGRIRPRLGLELTTHLKGIY